MTPARLICAVVFGIVTLAFAGPVEAQIYLSHDANGNLALSDAPPRGAREYEYKTYAVPGASRPISATRPPSGDYAGQFDDLIQRHSTANGVRTDLVRAVIQVESGYNPRARSPKGAMGLMQLMPGTALDSGVINAYDPEDNIRGGVRYLRSLLDRYGDNEKLALAAYNAGPEAVDRYGHAVPPYRETQNYVERVQNISPLSAAAAATPNQTTATPRPLGVRTLYKTVVLNSDGQPVARYSDSKPAAGDFEIYSYRH